MDELELLDWRRRVFELYDAVREEASIERATATWRAGRDALFATHAQSPLPAARRSNFAGLPYFPFDAEARVIAAVVPAEHRRLELGASTGAPMSFVRFALARFQLAGAACELELYWLDAYGGGLFVPVADETSGSETFGGGRYLLDTVKGADLGSDDGRLVLDFNLAYNPSCAYESRWACPLTPPANRLAVPVRAGERQLEPR
jgi:uncharacterized protein (DUF1684 family)